MNSAFSKRALALLSAMVGLAWSGGASAQSAAGDPDIRNIRPIVMLLLDTSGSMERMPGAVGTTAALPVCSGSPAGTNDRNRWATVVEALTGSWDDSYYCTAIDRSAYRGFEDFNYYLDYHQPPLNVAQSDNGVLDRYLERIKFGLMTFDATYTFIDSHPLLVPRSTFLARHPVVNQGNIGGYSYGEPAPLTFDGCATTFMVDSGARNASASTGAMISVGDDSTDYRLTNQQIQEVVRNVRPFGGTPTAALLTDLEHYLNNDSDVTSGDPFSGCRSRVGILVTDGEPDADFRGEPFNCVSGTTANRTRTTCPYRTSSELASSLCAYSNSSDTCTSGLLDRLFVVAFDVADPDDPAANATLAQLNEIADNGGTGRALLASNREELIARLAEALDTAAPGNTTRSNPAFVQAGTANAGGSVQLEFNAGFRVGEDGGPWSGILERTQYLCNDRNQPTAEPASERVRFDQTLSRQLSRRLLTVQASSRAAMSGNIVGEEYRRYPVGGTNPDAVVRDRSLTTFGESIPMTLLRAGGSRDERERIVSWVRADDGTERADNALGDIYHSSPVAVSPPTSDIADEAYNLFRAQPEVANRPTTLYVGSNDGILHAFVSNDWEDSGAGQRYRAGHELWGFIPPALVESLGDASNARRPMLDGTPIVRDVYYSRLPGATPAGSDYHTILLMGFRAGHRGYFALDVTNPQDPIFLWQYTGNRDGSTRRTPMGNSYGAPAIGQALVEIDGLLSERAIAVLPGGMGELDTRNPATGNGGCPVTVAVPITDGTTSSRNRVRCWEKRGRVLTVLDIATGQVIREFDASHFNSPLTGGVSLYPGDAGTVARRAAFTDMDGVIWTLDMRLTDPNEWVLRPLHDIFHDLRNPEAGQPAYPAPRLTVDPEGQLVVLQGTGDIDALDTLAENRVVSVTETVTYSRTGEPSYSSALNWEVRLQDGEQVTGPMQLFEGTAYFATFQTGADPTNLCAFGQSRIWGVDYIQGESPTPNVRNDSVVYEDVLAGYFPAARQSDAAGGFQHYVGPYQDRLILGVGITQRPTCVVGDEVPDPYLGTRFRVSEVGGGQFELIAQASGGSASEGAIDTITQTLPSPASFSTIVAYAGQVDY